MWSGGKGINGNIHEGDRHYNGERSEQEDRHHEALERSCRITAVKRTGATRIPTKYMDKYLV